MGFESPFLFVYFFYYCGFSVVVVCALLLEFQSCWSSAVVCAVLVIVPVPVICAVMVIVVFVLLLSVPIFQIPVVGLYVPWLVSDIHVNPVGSVVGDL